MYLVTLWDERQNERIKNGVEKTKHYLEMYLLIDTDNFIKHELLYITFIVFYECPLDIPFIMDTSQLLHVTMRVI